MTDTTASPTTTREAVLEAAKKMLAEGLVEGTSGNISGRLPDGLVCLTPSSVPYDSMLLEDLVVVDLAGMGWWARANMVAYTAWVWITAPSSG